MLRLVLRLVVLLYKRYSFEMKNGTWKIVVGCVVWCDVGVVWCWCWCVVWCGVVCFVCACTHIVLCVVRVVRVCVWWCVCVWLCGVVARLSLFLLSLLFSFLLDCCVTPW